VSTLCICIVFMPLFLLGGVARYLFVPLAEAVVFAMLASYLLSRTLVPTLVMYMLRLHEDEGTPATYSRAFRKHLSDALSACAASIAIS
jgi:multidrug efflux pump subunit AcrB